MPRHPLNALLTLIDQFSLSPCAGRSRLNRKSHTSSFTHEASHNACRRRAVRPRRPPGGTLHQNPLHLPKNAVFDPNPEPPRNTRVRPQGTDQTSGRETPRIFNGFCHRPAPFRQIADPRREKPWWRWTDLNRRPPACKAGALPLSYTPKGARPQGAPATAKLLTTWWAGQDLNLRPHAYQACALTS